MKLSGGCLGGDAFTRQSSAKQARDIEPIGTPAGHLLQRLLKGSAGAGRGWPTMVSCPLEDWGRTRIVQGLCCELIGGGRQVRVGVRSAGLVAAALL
jgi:hypothetical protein